MPNHHTKRLVRFSPGQMFDLVADVERYPQFVPMCEKLVIRRRTPAADGVEMLVADMSIGYKMISEKFTTRVAINKPAQTIDVEYVDGPFKYLENQWKFAAAGTGCEVSFFIDYEFKSRTFGLLAGAVFETVYKHMINAFETRAETIYKNTPQGA
jgi:coenzyme Q-binding protein COQ10